jgi:ATP-dependent helicase/nuclease subunit B
MKTLLIGPAGCGKTRRVLDEFRQTLLDSDPLRDDFFFVIPSREHLDRIVTMLLRQGMKGFFHRRVITLSDLISKAFGVGDDGAASNVTRFLVLREILEKNSWDCFKEVQTSSGFLNLMLSFIAELKESLIPVEIFRGRMNDLKRSEPDLASKYEALASIYEAYEAGLKERGLRDRQDNFYLFQKRKTEGALRTRRFSKIWMDGFFDFSPLQFAYLKELCETAEDITVTLTLDPEPGREDLFDAAIETRDMLSGIGFETQCLKRPGKSFRAPALAAVERYLFRTAAAKIKPAGEIAVFEAIGMEGEIEMIARSIERQHESGNYRFSDFAILLREIGGYESVIRSVFSRYGIPFELHEREKLSFSPMIQVIVALLRIFKEDWKRADLMEFLKSSYVRLLGAKGKDYEWVGALEHQAMMKGVFRGRQNWLDDWGEEAFDSEKKERLRPLADLEEGLRCAQKYSRFRQLLTQAVTKTFEIFQFVNSAEEYVRRDAAGFRRFEALLDEIEKSLRASAGGEVTFDQFTDRFLRLAELDLYSLHDRDKNRVQIYDISLARQKEYRVVYIAGLLEKKFPVQIKEDPVLSDWERRLFSVSKQAVLKERLPRQKIERYLFYIALTRASEKVFLTYPRLDLEGKESLPSYYVDELKMIFVKGSLAPVKQSLGRPYPDLEEAVNRRELELGLMGTFWNEVSEGKKHDLLTSVVASELLKLPQARERFRRAFYRLQDEITDPAALAVDAFRSGRTSASKLEDYAKCPFKFYAKHVLQLKDPEEDGNVKNRGTILHEVLEICFRDWMKQPAILRDPEKARRLAFLQLDKSLKNHPLLNEKKYQHDLDYENLRETLKLFLDKELERLAASPLQPRYFEYDFGVSDKPDAPALEIKDGSQTIRVRGKIDRIDVDAGGKAGAVIDYKSSAKFDRRGLEFGTALQLPIYSMVFEKELKLKLAGAELYSIRGREKKGFYHAAYKELFPEVSGRAMILEEKEFREVLARSEAFIKKFARGMREAKIPVKPRLCEDHCPYGPVCRIEKWRLPLIEDEIRKEDETGSQERKNA